MNYTEKHSLWRIRQIKPLFRDILEMTSLSITLGGESTEVVKFNQEKAIEKIS